MNPVTHDREPVTVQRVRSTPGHDDGVHTGDVRQHRGQQRDQASVENHDPVPRRGCLRRRALIWRRGVD